MVDSHSYAIMSGTPYSIVEHEVIYDPPAGVNCLHACMHYLLTGHKLSQPFEYAYTHG